MPVFNFFVLKSNFYRDLHVFCHGELLGLVVVKDYFFVVNTPSLLQHVGRMVVVFRPPGDVSEKNVGGLPRACGTVTFAHLAGQLVGINNFEAPAFWIVVLAFGVLSVVISTMFDHSLCHSVWAQICRHF